MEAVEFNRSWWHATRHERRLMFNDQAAGVMGHEVRTSRTTEVAALVARYALVIVLVWFGAMKFTYFETHNISPLIANSPLFSWIYDIMSIRAFGRFLGPAELVTAALLAVKPWFPKASVLGGLMACGFFVTTLSTMITTPAVAEASAGGFPVLSANGQFLMKDIALLGDAVDPVRKQPTTTTESAADRHP
jgi:uncharacterized membrane protein YkgB